LVADDCGAQQRQRSDLYRAAQATQFVMVRFSPDDDFMEEDSP
jgi:hypothetical protein